MGAKCISMRGCRFKIAKPPRGHGGRAAESVRRRATGTSFPARWVPRPGRKSRAHSPAAVVARGPRGFARAGTESNASSPSSCSRPTSRRVSRDRDSPSVGHTSRTQTAVTLATTQGHCRPVSRHVSVPVSPCSSHGSQQTVQSASRWRPRPVPRARSCRRGSRAGGTATCDGARGTPTAARPAAAHAASPTRPNAHSPRPHGAGRRGRCRCGATPPTPTSAAALPPCTAVCPAGPSETGLADAAPSASASPGGCP